MTLHITGKGHATLYAGSTKYSEFWAGKTPAKIPLKGIGPSDSIYLLANNYNVIAVLER